MTKNEDGQSTIEFLMSFIFIFGFVMMFARLAINYTNGYLVHYSTFMASRAFMIFDNEADPVGTDSRAMIFAREYFDKFSLDGFVTNFSSSLQINLPTSFNDAEKTLYIGAYVDFEDKFATPNLGPGQYLQLRSESFLGREPVRLECAEEVCNSIRDVGGNCEIHATIVDNGC